MFVVGFLKPSTINGYYFMNYLTRVLKINKILLVIAEKARIFFPLEVITSELKPDVFYTNNGITECWEMSGRSAKQASNCKHLPLKRLDKADHSCLASMLHRIKGHILCEPSGKKNSTDYSKINILTFH